MRKQAFLLVLFAMLISLPVAAAPEGRVVSVPVKGVIDAAGPVELLLTFYDRAVGGRELYSVTRTVNVTDNIYFDVVDVPESALRGKLKVFVEAAHADTPAIPLGERQQFARRGQNRAIVINGCSLCFSCGGAFPFFSGAFNTPVPPNTQERGSSCAGSPTQFFADTRPFLCCQ